MSTLKVYYKSKKYIKWCRWWCLWRHLAPPTLTNLTRCCRLLRKSSPSWPDPPVLVPPSVLHVVRGGCGIHTPVCRRDGVGGGWALTCLSAPVQEKMCWIHARSSWMRRIWNEKGAYPGRVWGRPILGRRLLLTRQLAPCHLRVWRKNLLAAARGRGRWKNREKVSCLLRRDRGRGRTLHVCCGEMEREEMMVPEEGSCWPPKIMGVCCRMYMEKAREIKHRVCCFSKLYWMKFWGPTL
jgi:hypothetical protein